MLSYLQTNKISFSLLVLVLLGVADASYLTFSHFFGGLKCLGATECDQVLLSPYATLFGVPLALLGLGYYLVLTAVLFYFFQTGSRRAIGIAAAISGLGLLFSLWLVYLQYAVILAWCSYCLISATITATIFLISLVLTIRSRS